MVENLVIGIYQLMIFSINIAYIGHQYRSYQPNQQYQPNIGQYYSTNIVLGTSKSDMILPIFGFTMV